MVQYIVIQSELKCASEHYGRNKQKMSVEENQTVLLESMQCNVLGNILYCIRKYFILWDVQLHSNTWRSRNDLERGCF